jgi:hypothetical protein
VRCHRRHVIAIVIAVLALSGCQASERELLDSYTDSSGVIRCAQGQSAVGETWDVNDDGEIPFGASTVARRDLYCANDQATLGSSWSRLEVKAVLYHLLQSRWQVCARPPDGWTTSAGGVTAATAHQCGATYYYVLGAHQATRIGGATSHGGTTSPTVFVNPN